MTLRSIQDRYLRMARQLNAPSKHVHFATTPQHDGSPHIECVGDEFHFVVTERGAEFERRKTSDPDEVLFWLTSGLTWAMASDWELQHRIDGEDSRRQLFRKDVELLSRVNTVWAERKKEGYEKLLGKYSFDDKQT